MKDVGESSDLAAKADLDRARVVLPTMVRIDSPCSVDWDSMSGDDCVRACTNCSQKVFNLSRLPAEDAMTFLKSNTDSLCVRIHVRKDGTITTQECPLLRKSTRLLYSGIAAVVSLLLIAVPMVGWMKRDPQQYQSVRGHWIWPWSRSNDGYVLMGSVLPPIVIPLEEEEFSAYERP